MRPATRLGDTKVGQQEGGCLSLHWSAAIGVQRQLSGWDAMLDKGVVEKFLEQDGVFGIGLAAAENVRRRGRGESSGDAAGGAGTIVGLRPSLMPAAFVSSIGPFALGITTKLFSCSQV